MRLKVLNIKVMRRLRSEIEALKEMLIHSADPRLLKVTKGYCIEVMKELMSKIEALKGNTQRTYILAILELKSEIEALKEMLIHSADPRLIKVIKGFFIKVIKGQ